MTQQRHTPLPIENAADAVWRAVLTLALIGLFMLAWIGVTG